MQDQYVNNHKDKNQKVHIICLTACLFCLLFGVEGALNQAHDFEMPVVRDAGVCPDVSVWRHEFC